MIDTATYVYFEEDSYSIIIKLNKLSSIGFEKITEQNIGNYLQILFQDKTIPEAIAQSKIPNGLILINRLDDEKFNRIWKELKE